MHVPERRDDESANVERHSRFDGRGARRTRLDREGEERQKGPRRDVACDRSGRRNGFQAGQEEEGCQKGEGQKASPQGAEKGYCEETQAGAESREETRAEDQKEIVYEEEKTQHWFDWLRLHGPGAFERVRESEPLFRSGPSGGVESGLRAGRVEGEGLCGALGLRVRRNGLAQADPARRHRRD